MSVRGLCCGDALVLSGQGVAWWIAALKHICGGALIFSVQGFCYGDAFVFSTQGSAQQSTGLQSNCGEVFVFSA